jgi:hydroxymethylbilane synthase
VTRHGPRRIVIDSSASVGAASLPRARLPLRAGTRGSALALAQTASVAAALAPGCDLVPEVIVTTGDATQASARPLAELGGKGLWAREIHQALLGGRIDLAVHSLKDLETTLPEGLVLAAVLPRADPRDGLLLSPGLAASPGGDPFACLPRGARVGTSSVRRAAQLRARRPDLRILPLRGNVPTRLGRLADGSLEAILLALAGLHRLGVTTPVLPLSPEVMLPACGQGIIGVVARADDAPVRALLAALDDPPARRMAEAERALLAALDGSCRTPIGGHARLLAEGGLVLEGLVARADGSFLLRRRDEGPAGSAASLGFALGQRLRAASPADIFA